MALVISQKYEVLGQLGQGAMGTVYKVRHAALGNTLALKVLASYLMENQEFTARFLREARLMAQLQHPSLVRVLDIDRDEDLGLYFVMEYIQGKTLREYLRERGPLPLLEVLEISRQVASALACVHNYTPPVVHRDVKPANIMIEDHSGRVVVMDFGIAKEMGGESESTEPGIIVGTVKYCPPEQIRHEPLEGRADIYSLGMVMYEMYTGTQFFAGLDVQAVIDKVLDDKQDNEPRFDRLAPPAFTALVTKAIAKTPEHRFQRMEELLQALESCRDTLEDSRTVVIAAPNRRETRVEQEREDAEDLDAQIRRLEEERQRRIAMSSQQRAQTARKHALEAGAREWGAALLQQGIVQDEEGKAKFQQREYTVAQQVYQQAASLFERAYEEARAATVPRAQQARQEMIVAKTEAERYGARDRASVFYSRGFALQVQGDELLEQQVYQQAGEVYRDALRSFSDAHDLAYRETLRDEIEAAREQLATAREAAKGAVMHEALQQATVSEQEATKALEQGELTRARELYLTALQQYQLAQQQVQGEKAVGNDVKAAARQVGPELIEKVQQQSAPTKAARPVRVTRISMLISGGIAIAALVGWFLFVRPVSPPTEKEVRSWLETYRQAWEKKDVEKLMSLGEVRPQDADRLRNILASYQSFHVAVSDVDLNPPQGNERTVTFFRVDTIDGKALPQPPKTVTLQKETDGRLVAQR